jgi:hypothetical protein
LERTTKILKCETLESIPSLESIAGLLRSKKLKLIFGNAILNQRIKIGEELKKKLDGYQVGIHTQEPEINIAKLITDAEIETHQDFFERCAKDYRALATKLFFELAAQLQLEIREDFPLFAFNRLKRDAAKSRGKMKEWFYFLHGYHCRFENRETGQCIEVPLVFGFEFGDLDPYFFSQFINSTKEYHPLPVAIYEDYADGERILKKMIWLGKFETINSNLSGHEGIVVTDRDKIKIKLFKPS